MDTQVLRNVINDAATRTGGKLWPNGLGYDRRRWEYTYSEARDCWQALYRPRGYGNGAFSWLGYGATPEEARAKALKVTND